MDIFTTLLKKTGLVNYDSTSPSRWQIEPGIGQNHVPLRQAPWQNKKYGGDSASGYLVAIDPKTGKRLWMLKVYSALTLKPGAPGGDGEMYFGRMTLGPNEDELTIETEFGARYLVNLRLRTSTLIFSPGNNEPNDDIDLPDLMAPPL